MPRLSFALRDVFWLTLVVGMGVGWWMQSRYDAQLHEAHRQRESQMLMTLQNTEKQIVALNKEVKRLSYSNDELIGVMRESADMTRNRKPADAAP